MENMTPFPKYEVFPALLCGSPCDPVPATASPTPNNPPSLIGEQRAGWLFHSNVKEEGKEK